MREVFKGVTSMTQYVVLRSSTTGLGLTGKVFGDITGSYTRNRAARTAITMATLASASAAFSSGGFILVDDTNCPGLYRFDIPDAAFATGADKVIVSLKCTGAIEEHIEFLLTDWNKQVAAIPNAAAGAAGGLITSGATGNVMPTDSIVAASIATDAITAAKIAAGAIGASEIADGAIDAATFAAGAIDAAAIANGAIDAATFAAGAIDAAAIANGAIDAATFAAGAITAAVIATDAIDSDALAADAVTEIQSGLATSAALATVQADTDNIQTRLPAALVGGKMDSDATSISGDSVAADNAEAFFDGTGYAGTNNVIPSVTTVTGNVNGSVASVAAGGITAASVATGAIDADALAADAASEIATAVLAGTISELGVAAPAATPTLAQAVMLPYMALRDKRTVTSTKDTIFNDAGTAIAHADLTDDGTTFTASELASGA